MDIVRRIRIPRGNRVTLDTLIRSEFEIEADNIPAENVLAMIDEIWEAPVNLPLHSPNRTRKPEGSTEINTLELLPDEEIYVPAQPLNILLRSTAPVTIRLCRQMLTGTESSDEEICQKVRASVACPPAKSSGSVPEAAPAGSRTDWSKEWNLPNPADTTCPDTFRKDTESHDTSCVDWSFPGGKFTTDDLREVVYNAPIRRHTIPKEVFYFLVPTPQATIAAGPSTTKKVVNLGRATPEWLFVLWHWIDRLKELSKKHRESFSNLRDMIGMGQLVVSDLASLEHFLKIYKREAGPPGHLWDSDETSQRRKMLRIDSLISSVAVLKDACVEPLVTNPAFPEMAAFKATCLKVREALDAPEFFTAYQEFLRDRKQYPAADQALHLALINAVQALSLGPNTDDFMEQLEKAVMEDEAPKETPLFREVVTRGKWFVDNAAPQITNLVGNVPGPYALPLSVRTFVMLRKIPNARGSLNADKFAGDVAKFLKFDAKTTEELLNNLNRIPKERRLFLVEIEAVDLLNTKFMAGVGMTTFVGLLGLLMFASATATGGLALGKSQSISEFSKNALSFLGAGFVTAGAAAQLYSTLYKTTADAATLLKLNSAVKFFGLGIAGVCILSGMIQLAEGLKKKDDSGNADILNPDTVQGIGSILIGMQVVLQLFARHGGSRVAAKIVASRIAIWVLGEAGTFALAQGVVPFFVALGAACSGVGVLLSLGGLYWANRESINAWIVDNSIPGPLRFCHATLEQCSLSRPVKFANLPVWSGFEKAKTALEESSFVDFSVDHKVRNELKLGGLDEADLGLVVRQAAFQPVGSPRY